MSRHQTISSTAFPHVADELVKILNCSKGKANAIICDYNQVVRFANKNNLDSLNEHLPGAANNVPIALDIFLKRQFASQKEKEDLHTRHEQSIKLPRTKCLFANARGTFLVSHNAIH